MHWGVLVLRIPVAFQGLFGAVGDDERFELPSVLLVGCIQLTEVSLLSGTGTPILTDSVDSTLALLHGFSPHDQGIRIGQCNSARQLPVNQR